MLKVKVGLSNKRKVPAFYILGNAYLPHKALVLLWLSRWINEVEHNGKYVIFEVKGQRLKVLKQYAFWMVNYWQRWQNYIPSFSLRGKTVLDIGAGCGETALLFFLHGAHKVIAIEPDFEAISCFAENVRNNDWNVEIIASPFSVNLLKNLDYDFMKMATGLSLCEESLLEIEIDKPCVVEVHDKVLLTKFLERGWRKIYEGNRLFLVKNWLEKSEKFHNGVKV